MCVAVLLSIDNTHFVYIVSSPYSANSVLFLQQIAQHKRATHIYAYSSPSVHPLSCAPRWCKRAYSLSPHTLSLSLFPALSRAVLLFLTLSFSLSISFSSLLPSLPPSLSFSRSLVLSLSLSSLFSHTPPFSYIFQILRKSVSCPSHSLFSLLARPLACPRSSSLPSPTPTLSHSFARLPSAYRQLLLPLPCLLRSPLPLLLCPPAGKLPRYVCVVVSVCKRVCACVGERERVGVYACLCVHVLLSFSWHTLSFFWHTCTVVALKREKVCALSLSSLSL